MECMKFGEKVRKYRTSIGMTQRELAQVVGVSQPRWSNWEKAAASKIELGLVKLLRLARTLGVPLDYLADDELDDVPMPASPEEMEILRWVRVIGIEDSRKRLAVPPPSTLMPSGARLAPGDVDISSSLSQPRRTARPAADTSRPAGQGPSDPSESANTTPGPVRSRRKR